MKDLGLYINFPFCTKKCTYCDFHSFEGIQEYMPLYIDALDKEISSLSQMLINYKIKTIFMGGGTPTILHEDILKKILETCHDKLNISKEAEVTIESNPSTLSQRKLSMLRSAGINRLRIGFQARQEKHLKTLGRQHTAQDFISAVEWARAEGFENINADILFSLPGQSNKDLSETIIMAIESSITHLSLYSLKIEEKTPLYEAMLRGEFILPEDDEDRKMLHEARDQLSKNGFVRYEISNYARFGMECAHNLLYWQNNEYIGCGSSAHSYFDNTRYANHSDVKEYIRSINKIGERSRVFVEKVDKQEERFETLMLGLRLIKGIDKESFKIRFGNELNFYYKDKIKLLKEQGLLEESNTKLYCTQKGLDLQNYVVLNFME